MEENRLKPMPIGYDEKMFNSLYKKTEPLRKKLASQIDSRRFGLSYEDILSFFDVKFLFTFEKYHQQDEGILLGNIINSLSNFKCRILRMAYTQKFSQSISPLEDHSDINHLVDSSDDGNHDFRLSKVMTMMKLTLSDNAYSLLEVQLNPPPFILEKLKERGFKNFNRIPEDILLDYFDLGTGPKARKFLDNLKKEIKIATNYCKNHFHKNPITVS